MFILYYAQRKAVSDGATKYGLVCEGYASSGEGYGPNEFAGLLAFVSP